MNDPIYLEQILNARAARDKRLKTSRQSWLALVGLFHLEEGENTFGASVLNMIILKGFEHPTCGSFHLRHGKVLLIPSPNSNLTINNLPAEARLLHTDRDEKPDMIQVGSLTMRILLRGQNHYLRVWDSRSPAVNDFSGLKYYPVKTEYRITARYVRYDPPQEIRILDVIGTESASHLIGAAHFTLNGVDCSLVAEGDGDELLFSFTDKTGEDTTYPGGRFLTTLKPEGPQMMLDFNLAVNWPCAYTAFATCPIPPRENHLSVRIEAGEMRYQK